MKRTKYLTILGALLFASIFSITSTAAAQAKSATLTGNPVLLINEVEADPGNQQNDSCQYIELKGTPGSTIPANTYFVAIDSDQGWNGRLNHVVAVGGVTIGANGIVYLTNTVAPVCPNRTAAEGTTVVEYSSVLRIGGGDLEVKSESFAIITTSANIFAGLDIDTNDDGVLDIAISNIYDAVAFRIDPDQQYVFPENAAILGTPFTDVPDAFVRFPGNNTPFSAAAFYYGELESSPVESTVFAAPFSANFPKGGKLTPGAINVPSTAVTTPARADFDGDGKTDVSIFRATDGNWWINGSSSGVGAINWGMSGDSLVPGDYDNDGKTDFAIFRAADDSSLPDFYVLNSNGFTVSGVSWGITGDVPTAADFDGDGKTDFAVYRAASNTWYILRSSDNGMDQVSVSGTTPVAGDYDGDGKADTIVYTDGNWTGALSGGGSLNVSLGAAGDILAPGDFDGDGKFDPATFRPADGTWRIVKSSNGQTESTHFGTNGDVPVPGDYDGDGTEDLAIYRGGFWWVRGSLSGVTVQQFGISTDVPVPNYARK